VSAAAPASLITFLRIVCLLQLCPHRAPVIARDGGNRGALRNHNAVTVLEHWQPGKNVSASKAGVGRKSVKQGGSKLRSASPRRTVFAEKNLIQLCS
jgi:hypothetical protein